MGVTSVPNLSRTVGMAWRLARAEGLPLAPCAPQSLERCWLDRAAEYRNRRGQLLQGFPETVAGSRSRALGS